MTKHKHLTLSDRNDIQTGLERGKTFKEIAAQIGKDPSTVSKEVRKHREIRVSTVHSTHGNTCPKLAKAPYTCNGCPMRNRDCGFTKQFYFAKRAQVKYEETLSDAREGIALNKESFYEMNTIVSQKLKDGQHLNHIIASNDLGTSRASIYRYVAKGYMDAKPIDLPRAVKFKKRRTRELPPIPRKDKLGRTYADFLKVLSDQGISSWLEMDTVIGKPGGKVLLTFNLTFCNFIFARLSDNKSALEVAHHIQTIKRDFHLAQEDFSRIFPIILTDNGGEFARVDDIEIDYEGQSHLFFCEPNRSDQKGRIEKNHTLVRDILPKGSSFDDLTQEDINRVMSHVNSVRRAALGNKTAYELFTFTYSEKIANLLGIAKIPDQDVCQSPKLLKK